MRFNHMELTLAPGTLDDEMRRRIGSFYGDIFGWSSMNVRVVGQDAFLLSVDPTTSQFLLVAESPKPMQSPGYDHLGLLLETRSEVDGLLERCRAFQQKDDRVQIKEYEDLLQGPLTVHAFYVKHLLPIWFDVQCMEWRPGAEPRDRWTYGPAQRS